MTTCKRCKKRNSCRELCHAVERLLPKDETGKDSHREISMGTDAFLAVVERYSCAEWNHYEAVDKGPGLDLSRLSSKEKRSVLLIMSGLTQREAASRMKISRLTLRTLIHRASKKLRVAQTSHLIGGKNSPGQPDEKGGSR